MTRTTVTYNSPLHQTMTTIVTDLGNDSCSIEGLFCAIENRAVDATTNPTIVFQVFGREWHLWEDRT